MISIRQRESLCKAYWVELTLTMREFMSFNENTKSSPEAVQHMSPFDLARSNRVIEPVL